MKIIIGLGNPGKNHEITRHNAGFLYVDYLQKKWGSELFHTDNKMFAEIASAHPKNETVLLVKPTTFMNASGTAISQLMHFYKLGLGDIAVIHDDLDIAPGTYKSTPSSRAAGHNGVSDIIEKLGSQDFYRIRLGIGRPKEISRDCLTAHDFVLQKFSPEELVVLSDLFPKVTADLSKWFGKNTKP